MTRIPTNAHTSTPAANEPVWSGRPDAAREEALIAARDLVRKNLARVAAGFSAEGLPSPALDGKILRPLAAYLAVPDERKKDLDDRFWWGALAVEMVHEASLLHDDILDDAPERRGKPTLAAKAGTGPALVLGDHLLTSAYRAAAATGSHEFLSVFIRAVERTVAGEIRQERSQGRILSDAEYQETVRGKSGELFRAVLSLPPLLLGVGLPERVGATGAQLGCLYQMVDDFLDYCPNADRGKPPLQDFRQRKWTWPLGLVSFSGFDAAEQEILEALFGTGNGTGAAPMEVGARRIEGEIQTLLASLGDQGLETDLLGRLVSGWLQQVRQSASQEVHLLSRQGHRQLDSAITPWRSGAGPEAEATAFSPADLEAETGYLRKAASALSEGSARLAYFGRHAKTFRFASRLFPKDALEKVAGVYAFCRFTDDLVDEAPDAEPKVLRVRLSAWLELAREAYETGQSHVPLLDDVLGSARRHGVPFTYAKELVEGVGMDISPRRYRTLEELRTYSHRVASVVGGWLTELFGIHDPWVLDRAFALGHAMQLTNILRDVGEDLRAGRLYIPEDLLESNGVDRNFLEAKSRSSSPMFPGYRRVLEELMASAEEDYRRAFQAIPLLPGFFQGPVAVAARVYEGIHDEIRRNGYDNLTRRAGTSLPRKFLLGMGALRDLIRVRKQRPVGPGNKRVDGARLPLEKSREAAA
jgi:phytoene synthase